MMMLCVGFYPKLILLPYSKLCICRFNTFQVIRVVSFRHERCAHRKRNVFYNVESIELIGVQLGLGN